MKNQNIKKINLREETITVEGMHCKSCKNSIESKINSLKGIKNIKVNLAENKTFVKFNPNEISLDKIRSEIEVLGYSTSHNNSSSSADTDYNKSSEAKNKTILQGVAYGLIPHIGCIAFIIGSILGVTVLMQFFKPLLMNQYFFYILIAISLAFATISSALYLKNNGLLSSVGMKKKWKYLSTMYGSTIGINLLVFMLIFPLLANVSASSPGTGTLVAASNGTSASLKLQVDIPCSGHAPLISQELKSVNGVAGIQFNLPNTFYVTYDSTKTSKQQILSLEVFKTYKATVLDESLVTQNNQQLASNQQSSSGQLSSGSGGCCGGGGSCGAAAGSGGGCGCGNKKI
jgi:copper chaperone CopZ